MLVNKATLESTPGILGILYRGYKKNPDQKFLHVGDKSLSYKELVDKGESCASALFIRGIRKNDKVGIMTANSTNWYVFMYAILRLGAIVVPFDPQLGQFEMTYLFDKVGVRNVLVLPSFRGLKHPEMLASLRDQFYDLKNVVVDGEWEENGFFEKLDTYKETEKITIPEFELNESDTNMFLCTTGSTGNPKIVDIPCKIFNNNLEKNAAFYGFTADSKEYLTMPMYHAGGFGWGLSCLSQFGEVYYEPAFQPTKLLSQIQNENITKLLITPTLMRILLSHPKINQFDISSLNQIIFTGEKLDDITLNKVLTDFKVRVTNAMGMSEAQVFLIWDSTRDRQIPNNQFSPVPGIVIKIIDSDGTECSDGKEGCILLRNAYDNAIMKGYYRLPEITKETLVGDGWLNTGDVGLKLENGKLEFKGRKKRVIKRGGNLVSPEEIEDFLRTNEFVAGVVIDHEEDSVIGEKIIAYINPIEGAVLTKDILLAFCKGKFSAYKIPDEFYFVPEIPQISGKTNLPQLKKMIKSGEIKIINQ